MHLSLLLECSGFAGLCYGCASSAGARLLHADSVQLSSALNCNPTTDVRQIVGYGSARITAAICQEMRNGVFSYVTAVRLVITQTIPQQYHHIPVAIAITLAACSATSWP